MGGVGGDKMSRCRRDNATRTLSHTHARVDARRALCRHSNAQKGLFFCTTGQLPPLHTGNHRTKDSKSRLRSINSRPNNSRPFRCSFEKCRLASRGVSQPFVSRAEFFCARRRGCLYQRPCAPAPARCRLGDIL